MKSSLNHDNPQSCFFRDNSAAFERLLEFWYKNLPSGEGRGLHRLNTTWHMITPLNQLNMALSSGSSHTIER